MTMQHQIHPDDERLAALAGGDPDAAADAELSAHVDSCSRCSDFVDELATLRSALAELPDLVPSRRLQLIPPVAEPRAAASGGFLRRLAAPVMAAGFGLVLVGAVGTSGILNWAAGSASAPGTQAGLESVDDASSPVSAEVLSGDQKSPVPDRSRATYSAGELDGAASASGSDSRFNATRSPMDPLPAQPGASEETVTELGGARDGSGGLFSVTDARLPWLVVLGLGVGVLLAGVFLRFSAQPRAG